MIRSLLQLVVVLLVGVLMNASSLYAGEPFSIQVPFAFHVGDTRLEAGRYEVYMRPNRVLQMVNTAGNRGTAIGVIPLRAAEKVGRPQLVFNRYGDESFLCEVLWPDSQAFELPKSKRERLVEKSGAKPAQRTASK